MTDLKLTIDQLKNYLGTGLKYRLNNDFHDDYPDLEFCSEFERAFSKGAIWELVGWSKIEIPLGDGEFDGELLQFENGVYKGNYQDSRPLCYHLSDLDKFIHELGFVPIEELDNHHNFSVLRKDDLMTDPLRYPFTVVQALFQWHFWPFGDEYFEAGLVIDKLLHGKESPNV